MNSVSATERKRYMRSRARDSATLKRWCMSARFAAARSPGPRTMDTSMMSRSRPWKTGGGPIAIFRATTSTGEIRSLTISWMSAACAVPSNVTTPMLRPSNCAVGQDAFDFVDDGLCLRVVHIALAIPAFHVHVNQRWVETLVGPGHAQRPDVALVELAVRELDDGGHAAEVLLEHHRVAGENHARQVVDGLVGRHLRAVRLIAKKPADELLDFLFGQCLRPTGTPACGHPRPGPSSRAAAPAGAQMSDCDASSMTTRSNSPTSGGIVSDTRHCGSTQQGTALYARSIASRAVLRCRTARTPVPEPIAWTAFR